MRLPHLVPVNRPEVERLLVSLVLLAGVCVFGIVGYVFIEGQTPLEALFMTVITISTVGYREVFPLSPSGQMFTVGLIVLGISVGAYAVATVSAFLIEGAVRDIYRRRRMEKAIAGLQDHIVVCGFGRLGREAVYELDRMAVPFVVIESNPDAVAELQTAGILHLQEDATTDAGLEAAGIERARGLISALASDADNLYVTLSARGLNPKLFIVARAEAQPAEAKLLRAGANRVVPLFRIGGRRMADWLVRPETVELFNLMVKDHTVQLTIAELELKPGSVLDGKTLRDTDLRSQTGALVVGVKTKDGRFRLAPPADMVLHAGDAIVVMGERPSVDKLRETV